MNSKSQESGMASISSDSTKNIKSTLVSLEEDDEFEDFPVEGK